MAGVGGYQKPTNPAAFSGVGAQSQRTDGGPSMDEKQAARYISGGSYGEGKDLMNIQQSAPMNAAPATPRPAFDASMLPPLPEGITPLNSPTQRPEEPLTAGVAFGEGENAPPPVIPLINNAIPQNDTIAKTIRDTYAAYPSPGLYNLVRKLEQEGR